MAKRKEKIRTPLCGKCFTPLVLEYLEEILITVYCPKCKKVKYEEEVHKQETISKTFKEETLETI